MTASKVTIRIVNANHGEHRHHHCHHPQLMWLSVADVLVDDLCQFKRRLASWGTPRGLVPRGRDERRERRLARAYDDWPDKVDDGEVLCAAAPPS